MARQRNYAAEYAARNARSQASYGITYNQQRGIIQRGDRVGWSPKVSRGFLSEAYDNGLDVSGISDVQDIVADLRDGAIDFDRTLDMLAEMGIDIDPDNIPEWLYYHK